ncbi:hypothetical protein KR100_04285 [Synechococcus sp. KORDI-100]|uniref:hypothetical protein n=1 Tax=Synechococcus sp. KORDI-100 TaxID=1280380 RepID=UPI0004E091CC|nr:hypothetical protein [Synechococcus sp. KORDI-100]AII42584.1 hypothetical protein KR100_04285 [Synechococcus sp. KORDI-100]
MLIAFWVETTECERGVLGPRLVEVGWRTCSRAVAMPMGERRERISEAPMRGKGNGRSDQAPWA